MGNAIAIIENKSDNEKIEYLRKEGLLNDEIIKLYFEGNMSVKDIIMYMGNTNTYQHHK